MDFPTSLSRLPLALSIALVLAVPRSAPGAAPSVFDVRDHGAVGDGKILDTPALQKAIDACAAAGGGVVLLPPGTYLSGTVDLRSGVTLKLEAGVRLVGTPDLERYREFTPLAGTPEAKWGRWHRALVLGVGVEKVSIVGQGTIDGNKVFDPRGEERMRGPHTIIFGNSKDVEIRGISVRDSANYAIFFQCCERATVRDVEVTGGWDGVHFRGWIDRPCRDLRIVGCRFFTGDDSIAGRYVENLLVSGCVVNSSCNGVRIIGPLRNFVLHDCLFYGPGVEPHRTGGRHNMLSGIILQPGAWDTCDGALEDVFISQVAMKAVASPVTISLQRPGNTADRITVSRLSATGVYRAAASVESWIEAPVGHVTFRDCDIEYAGGGKRPPGAGSAPEKPGVDARALPAWGFLVRNVRDLRLEDVRLSVTEDDERPAIAADRVERLILDGLRLPAAGLSPDAVVLDRVGRLDLPEGGLVPEEWSDLKVVADDPGGRFVAGKPFSVSVTVAGGGRAGLARIEILLDGQKIARWTWLPAGGKSEAVFRGLTTPAPGNHEVRCGPLMARSFTVEP